MRSTFQAGVRRSLRTLTEAFPDATFDCLRSHPCRRGLLRADVRRDADLLAHRSWPESPSNDTYDLIWSGSFFTPPRPRPLRGLPSLFESLLKGSGLLIFTAHSAGHREALRQREMEEATRAAVHV